MAVLPARRVICARVGHGAHARGDELRGDLVRFPRKLVARALLRDGDHNHLRGRDARRQDEALVVRVHHHHHADRARRQPPRVLPGDRLVRVLVLVLDLEHLAEVLPEAVARGTLDPAACVWDEALHSRRVVASGELLLFGLLALHHRHREQLLVHATVKVKDIQHLLVRVRLVRVRRVPLLPQELGRAEEGAGAQLPAQHVRPLVHLERQVAVRRDPPAEHVPDDRLGGGPHDERLLELSGRVGLHAHAALDGAEPVVRDDGALLGEALDVLGLL
mmetsp:Transcript_18638/g.47989  ORF Transcript_18638/g.47989 Transcript_18638/m.47989 type:complete len:276 (+) Transcript_18638:867-1694(+)